MKYNTIQNLDSRIENIIKRTVKHYITDWTQYDRPKFEGLKASTDRKDKTMVLIARKYGTYLITLDQIENTEAGCAIYDYFQDQEHATYYFIDLNKLELKKIDPAIFKIKRYRAA